MSEHPDEPRVAVTMTVERTVVVSTRRLARLLGRPDADEDLLVALVEDTDAFHDKLTRLVNTTEAETSVSFQADITRP